MILLILVSFLLAATNATLTEQGERCIESAYKGEALTSSKEIELCTEFLKIQKENFRKNFERGLNANFRKCNKCSVEDACNFFSRNTDCLIKTFDEYRIADLYMKGWIIYLNSEINGKTRVDYHSLADRTNDINEQAICLRRYAFMKNLINPTMMVILPSRLMTASQILMYSI